MRTTISKIFGKIVLLGVLVLGTGACSDWLEVDESNMRYVSFGTLDPVTQVITGDYGEMLRITEIGSNTSAEEIQTKGGRVCFNYSVLKRHDESQKNAIDIRLNSFYELLVDEIETLSTLNDEEREELGNTPATPVQAVVSGGYVNLQIAYVDRGKDDIEYDFELGYDDLEDGSTDNTLVLQIFHKGDDSGKPSKTDDVKYIWTSFKLNDDVLIKYGDKSSMDFLIMFRWKWWTSEGTIEENMATLVPSPYSELSE